MTTGSGRLCKKRNGTEAEFYRHLSGMLLLVPTLLSLSPNLVLFTTSSLLFSSLCVSLSLSLSLVVRGPEQPPDHPLHAVVPQFYGMVYIGEDMEVRGQSPISMPDPPQHTSSEGPGLSSVNIRTENYEDSDTDGATAGDPPSIRESSTTRTASTRSMCGWARMCPNGAWTRCWMMLSEVTAAWGCELKPVSLTLARVCVCVCVFVSGG
jgi:hypothetical protein